MIDVYYSKHYDYSREVYCIQTNSGFMVIPRTFWVEFFYDNLYLHSILEYLVINSFPKIETVSANTINEIQKRFTFILIQEIKQVCETRDAHNSICLNRMVRDFRDYFHNFTFETNIAQKMHNHIYDLSVINRNSMRIKNKTIGITNQSIIDYMKRFHPNLHFDVSDTYIIARDAGSTLTGIATRCRVGRADDIIATKM